jgi:phage N-6-adenine-methyltransferase
MRIYSTPQPIFDALHREFNFVVDLCADCGNAKVSRYMDREVSLSNNWNGRGAAWLNPPYGAEISAWVQKASETRRLIVGFLPGRTNAPWWHDYVMRAFEIRCVRRKVSFANGDGCKGVPPWGAMVAIWSPEWHGPNPARFVSWDWRNS